MTRFVIFVCNFFGGHDYVAVYGDDKYCCRCCGNTIPEPK